MTLDNDFANIYAYPPGKYPGILVLRPASQAKPAILQLVRRLIGVFRDRLPDRELWIVEPDRIRYRIR